MNQEINQKQQYQMVCRTVDCQTVVCRTAGFRTVFCRTVASHTVVHCGFRTVVCRIVDCVWPSCGQPFCDWPPCRQPYCRLLYCCLPCRGLPYNEILQLSRLGTRTNSITSYSSQSINHELIWQGIWKQVVNSIP